MQHSSVGHIAETCPSDQRLCYNCRQPGHESAACPQPRSVAAKQCYSCGGVGHIQAECPSLRVQGANQKCYVSCSSSPLHICLISCSPFVRFADQSCGRFGHIARACPSTNSGFNGRPAPAGRGLNTASLPPVKCFRCGGLNHMSRSALKKAVCFTF